jgi:hypothetical protein
VRKIPVSATAALLFVTTANIIACGASPTAQGHCFYHPIPLKIMELVYPADGSTAVSTRLGVLITQGYFNGQPPEIATVSTQPGSTIVNTLLGAPSPLPSPLATPPIVGPYGSVRLPTLLPQTTYQVQFAHDVQFGDPRFCSVMINDGGGSFTTGST